MFSFFLFVIFLFIAFFFFAILTIPGHADGQTLLESAILTAIPVQSYDQTLAVPQAPVLDLFLYAPPEETLNNKTWQSCKLFTL